MTGDILVKKSGELYFNNKEYQCCLGENGVIQDKIEGDKKTPAGCFKLREVYFRADKIEKPKTNLPIFEIQKDDGWCDDVSSSFYNKKIKLPFEGSFENLWRDDDIYDLVVVIGYNDDPVISKKGSAIFMHIAREDYLPTEGCVALKKDDLLEILENCSKETKICIE